MKALEGLLFANGRGEEPHRVCLYHPHFAEVESFRQSGTLRRHAFTRTTFQPLDSLGTMFCEYHEISKKKRQNDIPCNPLF